MYTVGVDIGATKISFVLIKNRHLLKHQKIQTPKTKEGLVKAIQENIEKLIANISRSKISGIGIGVPGPINQQRGSILNPPNLTYLKNCPLAEIIGKKLGLKIKMENDTNCFTLAEALLGAGREAKIVFGVTLGTGVGGGIVIDKKIYRGADGGAGEAGHMTIKFNGSQCTCGSYGCLENYCSERFIKRKTGLSPRELEKKARKGDKRARRIFGELGKFLGIGLANIVNLLSPDIIVIGGGISKAGNLILEPAKKTMRKWIISPLAKKNVKIKKAKLGDFGGAIGAAFLLKD